MNDSFEFEDDLPRNPKTEGNPHGAGRPRGSRNKTPTQRFMLERFENLLKSVEHMLSEEQLKYYKTAFNGREELDPIKEMELLLRLHGVYTMTIITEATGAKKPSKEVSDNVAQQRMGFKDLYDMKRKKEEAEEKRSESQSMVDPTRQSEMGVLDRLLGKASTGD